VRKNLLSLQISGTREVGRERRGGDLHGASSDGKFPSAKENGGISPKPRTMWGMVKGVREPAETIVKLLAGSSLAPLAKK